MIKPKCIRCDQELKEFGAILLGPPYKSWISRIFPMFDKESCKKDHLCKTCYNYVLEVRAK